MKKTSGQAILEYAVLLACFVAAIVAMQIYIKRGLEGRFKSAADTLGEQYSPGRMDTNVTVSLNSTTHTKLERITEENDDGVWRSYPLTTITQGNPDIPDNQDGAWVGAEITKRSGYERVSNAKEKLFE